MGSAKPFWCQDCTVHSRYTGAVTTARDGDWNDHIRDDITFTVVYFISPAVRSHQFDSSGTSRLV